MREMCRTKRAYFHIIGRHQLRLSFSSFCPAVNKWHWYKSLCQEREGRLSWRRNRRSKFKAGLWEVMLFDPSLPGQLLSSLLHSGHAVSTKQGGYCTDVQALLGWSQVCVGKDASSLCDPHLRGLFINQSWTHRSVPTNNIQSGIKERKLFSLYCYTWKFLNSKCKDSNS